MSPATHLFLFFLSVGIFSCKILSISKIVGVYSLAEYTFEDILVGFLFSREAVYSVKHALQNFLSLTFHCCKRFELMS